MIPHQLHSEKLHGDNLTVEEIFNPLMGFGSPPRASRLEKGAPHCVTMSIGHLFNPLLDLEKLHADSHFPHGVPPTSLASINACRPSHIELSSLNSLQSLADFNDLARPRKKRVHFSGDVVIHWIPSHRDYSQKEYASMWSNPDEIAYNASRNRIEFRFEGWDWRAVLEETKLVRCADGELYHPVTVNLYLQQLRREEANRLAVRKRRVVSDLSEVSISKKHKLLQ